MSGLIGWLNSNSGALNALAALLSALFTAAAAVAAFVTIRRAQRRDRCNIDVFVSPTSVAYALGQAPEPSVQFSVVNLGPGTPLSATYDFDHVLGDALQPGLVPGRDQVLTTQPIGRCSDWCRMRISWLDPNGRKRRVRFWYRIEGRWDGRVNARKYLRVDRDERATYFPRPMYLRRRPPLRGYIDWRIRKHRDRNMQKLQAAWDAQSVM